MFRSWLKFADVIILIIALLLITTSVIVLYQKRGEALYVEISKEGETSLYPLSRERTLSLDTEIGEVLVKIEENSAAIIQSECPDQLCIRMGSISKSGEWAACLPAKVMISISGGKKEELDALSE